MMGASKDLATVTMTLVPKTCSETIKAKNKRENESLGLLSGVSKSANAERPLVLTDVQHLSKAI